jgi:hypothetical protein
MLLLQYASFYRVLYELPAHERPAETLIEDDEEIDKWWQAFERRIAHETAKAYGKTARFRDERAKQRIPEYKGE